jgi:hypothetical protein
MRLPAAATHFGPTDAIRLGIGEAGPRLFRFVARPQCEIIQGRLVGKHLEPSSARLLMRDDFPEQQAHPAPWEFLKEASVCGVCTLRSLVAWASRVAAGIVEK